MQRLWLLWLLGGLLLACAAIAAFQRKALLASAEREADRPLASRAPESSAAAARERTLRVLFVGNERLASEGIPAMVAQLASAAKEPRSFEHASETKAGFGLYEHAIAGKLRALLARARFDWVVLQDRDERPARPAEDRETWLHAPARDLHRIVREAGSRTWLYLSPAFRDGDPQNVPSDDYDAMQQRIAEGYAGLARELNVPLVPVGTVYTLLRREHPEIELWSEDGQRPSKAGAYLSACALYASFYRASPLGNPYRAELGAEHARAIQAGVAEVLLGWRAAEDGVPQASATERAAPSSALPSAALSAASTAPLAPLELEQDQKRRRALDADRERRALRAARSRVSVTLYTTSWCGYCRSARAYLSEQDIAFEEQDIERDAAAKAAVLRINPRASVPTIDVEGDVLVGWSQKRFESMFERAVRARARL